MDDEGEDGNHFRFGMMVQRRCYVVEAGEVVLASFGTKIHEKGVGVVPRRAKAVAGLQPVQMTVAGLQPVQMMVHMMSERGASKIPLLLWMAGAEERRQG